MGQETFTLTRTEMKKVLVVEKIIGGHFTNSEGAVALGLSTRQIIRLKQKYLIEGAHGIIHQNRGRKPAHTIEDALKERVIELYRTKYTGSNYCHYSELLEEHEFIRLSVPTIRRILLQAGLKQVKQRRRKKAHQPRNRKPQAGMLWQTDATPYAWLEDRAPAFTLHAAIDDATGTVVGATFLPNECREGYSHVMKQGIIQYGLPLGLYSDRHMIFRSPKEKLTVEQELAGEIKPLSNFGKAMAELNIEHIKAVTPQAKGRIERLWVTFQDRLVIELRLLGIDSMEEANKALPMLIKKHNQKFAVKPKDAESAYVQLDPSIDLNVVFSIREYRQLGPGNTIAYGGKLYTLEKPSSLRLQVKTTVEVRETLTGQVYLWLQGEALPLKETQKSERVKMVKKEASPAPQHRPAENHPWRKPWKQNHSQHSIAKESIPSP
jgi:transposase